jgi:hypothetical protein
MGHDPEIEPRTAHKLDTLSSSHGPNPYALLRNALARRPQQIRGGC